jgi:hypothetical protein
MGHSFRFCLATIASVGLLAAADVRAADMAGAKGMSVSANTQLALECDNGRTYPIRPRAVSDAGELVTGTIYTSATKGHPFRLVPMGNGYRYAGHGFWFDGIRGEATLDIGSKQATCTVLYGS